MTDKLLEAAKAGYIAISAVTKHPTHERTAMTDATQRLNVATKKTEAWPVPTAPEVRAADPQPKWIVHIAGPDDVLPFESEFAALRHANTVNKMYLRDRMKHPDDEVLCVAVVKHVDEIEPRS